MAAWRHWSSQSCRSRPNDLPGRAGTVCDTRARVVKQDLDHKPIGPQLWPQSARAALARQAEPRRCSGAAPSQRALLRNPLRLPPLMLLLTLDAGHRTANSGGCARTRARAQPLGDSAPHGRGAPGACAHQLHRTRCKRRCRCEDAGERSVEMIGLLAAGGTVSIADAARCPHRSLLRSPLWIQDRGCAHGAAGAGSATAPAAAIGSSSSYTPYSQSLNSACVSWSLSSARPSSMSLISNSLLPHLRSSFAASFLLSFPSSSVSASLNILSSSTSSTRPTTRTQAPAVQS
mmetsp:Transcript_50726/g.141595  ORF Transcript_50726/g.141595 Transcript_50726/m.141595 type:complete len:290 (+) Transcript_50726:140-1009(+)